jgi:hypothetical protein
MDDLRPVAFRFGHGLEVRYLVSAPARGDFVTHGHHLWVVLDVSEDDFGTIVVCGRNAEDRLLRDAG